MRAKQMDELFSNAQNIEKKNNNKNILNEDPLTMYDK